MRRNHRTVMLNSEGCAQPAIKLLEFLSDHDIDVLAWQEVYIIQIGQLSSKAMATRTDYVHRVFGPVGEARRRDSRLGCIDIAEELAVRPHERSASIFACMPRSWGGIIG